MAVVDVRDRIMTALVIVLVVAAVALWVWAEVGTRRDLRRLPVPPVVDPARSSSAGGFGPEWDGLIARAGEHRD